MADDNNQPVVQASAWYSRLLVFFIVMTVLTFATMIALGVLIPHPTESQQTTMDNVAKAFFGCLGAVAGAIGGKVL